MLRRFLLLAFFAACTPLASFAQGFGGTVAASPEAVFVAEGATDRAPGTVYVYRPDGDTWSEASTFRSPSPELGDRFGRALAYANGTLYVTQPSAEDGRGAVYVYEVGDEDDWTPVATVMPPAMEDDGADGDDGGETMYFGEDIAVHGDWMAVAVTPRNMRFPSAAGYVQIFKRGEDGAWSAHGTLTKDDAEPTDFFAYGVALGDGMAAVAAPRLRQGGGYVSVFRYDPEADAWAEAATLEPGEDIEGPTYFGLSTAVMGARVVVGMPGMDGHGEVAVFEESIDGDWQPAARLVPFDAGADHGFGGAVYVTDGQLWIGAPGFRRPTVSGAIYGFSLLAPPSDEAAMGEEDEMQGEDMADPLVFTNVTKIMNPTREKGDRFGSAIAVAGDVLVSGATGDDYGAGTIDIFTRAPTTMPAETEGEGATIAMRGWVARSTQASAPVELDAVTGERQRCTGEETAGFECQGMDLFAFLPISQVGGGRGVNLNDIWGWTDPETDREYALLGRTNGASFIDVTDPANPVYLGDLPMTEGAQSSSWRDIKVYADHAFIVSDNAGAHGMQVFDLTRLRDLDGSEPETFEADALYENIASAHNVVINEDSGFAYIVGAGGGGETCGGGLHMVNVQSPTEPTFAGCFADTGTGRRGTGYSHDAQCVNYVGPDADYEGREICFGSNETALSIADVTDKDDPKAITSVPYPNVAYSHQGWLTEDHRYLYMNDELDEMGGNVANTRTLIWDVSDLDDPILVKEFMHETEAIDHNLYIRGDLMYQSNYATGLRVFDISDRENPVLVGHIDTNPFGDNGPEFNGSWSNYPYFPSGTIVVSSIGEGLFVVRKSQDDI